MSAFLNGGLVNILVNKSFNDTAFEKMLGNDLRNILLLDTAVESAFGINDNNGAEGAQTEAACLNDLDFFAETLLCKLRFKG